MSDIVIRPIEKIKKNCICCGKETEIFPYEDRNFCDKCFVTVCRELFNKENDNMTVMEVREKIKRNLQTISSTIRH